jgi:hypothetical protein
MARELPPGGMPSKVLKEVGGLLRAVAYDI